jgi:hypothetical protein
MTGRDPDEAIRAAARELLGELVHNGHAAPHPAPAKDDAEIVPEVPAPPIAAVLRPSTWSGPAAPGEVIGERPPAHASPGAPSAAPPGVASDARVEAVSIDTDEELNRFARGLVARVENPRDRLAIHAGSLRFALRRSGEQPAAAAAASTGPQSAAVGEVRVMKGAVTERAVRAAAADRTRIVLARGAVLTPLARDCARALGVKIEREPRC